MATRTKRQFMMLSETREDDDNSNVAGWFASEKLDGIRMLWDGGISTGLLLSEVPFANIERDHVNRKYHRATGLWSRNAKVISAPDWFIAALPKMMLDGEVYAGRQGWEVTSSITKDQVPNERDWRRIKYMVFDSPPMDSIFQPGVIETDIYTKDMTGVLEWALERAAKHGITTQPNGRSYEHVYAWMRQQGFENDIVKIVEQKRLPYSTAGAAEMINNLMEEIIALKGEGLMLRKPESTWSPERFWDLVKVKKWYDAEATVLGYSWGKKTKKMSKHLGKMGALIVDWNDKQFEISGFTDAERIIRFPTGGMASDIGRLNPGGRVPDELINECFPRGSKVTFRYRDVSALGIPKNGNYWRKPSPV